MLNATTPLWTILIAVAVRHQKSAGLRQRWPGRRPVTGVSCVYMDRNLAHRDISPITLSACQLLAAALLLALTLSVAGTPTPHLTVTTVASLAVLGFIGTGTAYVLNYQIITSEGATIAYTVIYLLPVVAIVLGVLVLNEHTTVTVLAGIALILAGVGLTRRRS
jgi:drug/metabolite transporter (DMT)-like permease